MNSLDGLVDIRMATDEDRVEVGSGESLVVKRIGTFVGFHGKNKEIIVKNVAYVPSMSVNLFSLTK